MVEQTLSCVAERLTDLDGGEWTYSPTRWTLYRRGSDEAVTVRVVYDWRGNVERFKFTGRFPDTVKARPGVTASVDAGRSPAAIAREIMRRVLPQYRAQYAELVQRLAAESDYDTRVSALMRRLFAVLRVGTPGTYRDEATLFRRTGPSGYVTSITAKGYITDTGEQVDLCFRRIPAELAEKLLCAANVLTQESE